MRLSEQPADHERILESVVVGIITDHEDSPQQAQGITLVISLPYDVNDTEHYSFRSTKQRIKYQTEHNKVFFLSMAPQFFGTIAKHLKSEGL